MRWVLRFLRKCYLSYICCSNIDNRQKRRPKQQGETQALSDGASAGHCLAIIWQPLIRNIYLVPSSRLSFLCVVNVRHRGRFLPTSLIQNYIRRVLIPLLLFPAFIPYALSVVLVPAVRGAVASGNTKKSYRNAFTCHSDYPH